jgi:hypothetical protein
MARETYNAMVSGLLVRLVVAMTSEARPKCSIRALCSRH